MKKTQLIFASVVMTFLLSISVSAGIMEIGRAQPTPSPTPTTMTTERDTAEAEGVMSTGIIQAGVAAPVPVTEMALSVLQSVLALF